MNINEIKAGMYLKSDFADGDTVIVSEVFIEENIFSGFSLVSFSFSPDFLPNLFYPCTFHEAFRDNVNTIVMDAITNQHRDSLYDHTGRNSLAVSDMQKKWILDHYILKHEVDKNFADYVKLNNAHSVLIQEYKDLQNKFVELQKENQAYQEQNKKLTSENRELIQGNENKYAESEYKRMNDNIIQLQYHNSKLLGNNNDLREKVEQLNAEIAQLIKDSSDSIWYIGELKKFILHLQDYIAAKHLEENGLILEKYIQEENDGRKEST